MLALIIDGIIVGIVGGIVALPVGPRRVRHLQRLVRRGAERRQQQHLDTSQLQSDIARPLAIIGAINLALGFAYHVGFLMWKQATPGKLIARAAGPAAGDARPDAARRPSCSAGSASTAIGIVGLIPFVGSLVGIYSLLDYLWPLWDDKKQAIHDKIAKTNVVRIR